MEARHRALAEIALAAAGAQGLALAGGYAVRAHGMGNRPSGDVDLFTDWQRRADSPTAVETVVDAFGADAGFDPVMFAHALGALTQITDAAFADYDTPAADIAALRARFARWRDELVTG